MMEWATLIKGAMGGVAAVFITWGIGVWLNWRINSKVLVEQKIQTRLLAMIYDKLDKEKKK